MKLKEVSSFIKNLVEKKVKLPVILRGESGIGKSQAVQQAARELGFKCIDLRLAQMEPGDLIGLPRSDAETKTTYWAKPEWFPKEGKVIIFLDELNRAPVDVRQAIFQVLTDYRMHTHQLPEDCYIVSAINPDDGKFSHQVEQFDPAMVNRMCFIDVEPDVDQWCEWARNNDLHDMVIRFITVHPELLQKTSDTGPFPSPRMWHKLSDLLKADALPVSAQDQVLRGLVGDKPAIAFIRFMDKNTKKPVSAKEVLEDFSKVEARFKKQENSENYSTITDLAAMLGDGGKLSKGQLDNLVSFVHACGPELKVAFLKKLPHTFLAKLGHRDAQITNEIAKIINSVDEDKKSKK